MELFDNYMKRLARAKITERKEGSTATVFRHPTHPNVIARISTFKDPGGAPWGKICTRHPQNKWLPKTHGVYRIRMREHEFSPEPSWYSLVFMERLTDAGEKAAEEAVSKQCGTEVWAALKYLEGKRGGAASIKYFTSHVDVVRLAPSLLEAIELILTPSYVLDVPSNIMLRGSQVVFTDPWALHRF